MFPDFLHRGTHLRNRLHSHLKAMHEPGDRPWRPDLTTYKVLLLCNMISKQFDEEDEVHLRVTLDRALGKLLFRMNGGAQFLQRLGNRSLGFQHSLLQQSLLFATALVVLSKTLRVSNLQEHYDELIAITQTIPKYWGLDEYPDDDDEYYLEKVDVSSNQVCNLLNELADGEDIAHLPPKRLR